MTARIASIPLVLCSVLACAPCFDRGVNVGDACVPENFANDVALSFEVSEACGTSCAAPPACEVRVDGTTLTVVTGQTECEGDCVPTGVCEHRTAACALPPLSSGTYTLVLPGIASRTLTVASGGVASCTLGG